MLCVQCEEPSSIMAMPAWACLLHNWLPYPNGECASGGWYTPAFLLALILTEVPRRDVIRSSPCSTRGPRPNRLVINVRLGPNPRPTAGPDGLLPARGCG